MDVEPFADRGFAVVRDFVAPDIAAALRAHAFARERDGEFRPAGIGRADARTQRPDVRGDRILWLDEATPAPAEGPLIAALDALRSCMNATLYLGLWDVEAHYAIYAPGAFYARHRDRFANEPTGAPSRVVSFAVYLNERWNDSDGGALRIHVDRDAHVDVLPESGTLACFLADRFEHEVLPARRTRLSVAGWFRCRGER